MKKYFFLGVKVFLSLLLLSIAVLGTASVTYAKETTKKATLKDCIVQAVTLNGNEAPQVTCLQYKNGSGTITPAIGTTGCSQSSLNLKSWALSGAEIMICFIGRGFVNLTDYVWTIWGTSWNDRAQWYGTGCNRGYFFLDTNGNGTAQAFAPHTQGWFGYTAGALPELAVSSIRIDSSC